MKVGDLVKWDDLNGVTLVGVVVGFDNDNDPKVRSCRSGITIAHWRRTVKVISESR